MSKLDQRREDVFAALHVHCGLSMKARIMHCGPFGSSRKLAAARRRTAMPDIKSLTAAELLRLYRRANCRPSR